MKKLHEMRQELSEVRGQLRKLHEQNKGNDFTEAQEKQWDELSKRSFDLQRDIDDEVIKREQDQEALNNLSNAGGHEWIDTKTQRSIPVYRSSDKVFNSNQSSGEKLPTLGAYMRAIAVGPRNEEESRALSGSTGTAGGYTVPKEILSRWIDSMRAKSRAIEAGAQTVMLPNGETSIARLESDPVPAWRAENEAVKEANPTFGRVNFSAKSLAVVVKVSEELLQDSINVDSILMTSLAAAMSSELDRVALWGAGETADPKEPLGIANTTGIIELTQARTDTYKSITAGCRAMANENSGFPSAAIMSPTENYFFGDLVDANGQPLNKPPVIASLPMLDTTKATENELLIGDFSRLMIGIRQDMTIRILTERFSDNLQVGFICSLRADCAVEQPKAFCKVTLTGAAAQAEDAA